MSTVVCGDEFDLDIDYRHRTVTIQAQVDFHERDEAGIWIAVPAGILDTENSSATVRWEALPLLIERLQRLVDVGKAERGPESKP